MCIWICICICVCIFSKWAECVFVPEAQAVIPLVRFSALGFRLFPLHSYLRLLTFTYTCLTFLQYILAIIRTFHYTNHLKISYNAPNRPMAHLGKMQYTAYRWKRIEGRKCDMAIVSKVEMVLSWGTYSITWYPKNGDPRHIFSLSFFKPNQNQNL